MLAAAVLLVMVACNPDDVAERPENADRYYIIVFSSQSVPKRARTSHTFATFIRVSEVNGEKYLEAETISWLPATLRVRPLALRPEPGVNLDLDTTLRVVLAQNERVSAWGPYEVGADRYQLAMAKKAQLDSGEELYKAIDPLRRSSSSSDCIHAWTDIRSRGRLFYSELVRYGDSASHFGVHRLHVRGQVINPCARHDWILEALGLYCYPIWYREYNGWRFNFPQR